MTKIKTKLKFVKSDKTGAWVGFVSIDNSNGRVMGCRQEEDKPKKVCIASHELFAIIEPGVLYDVEMIPMKNQKSGFVVIKAEPHQFDAVVSSTIVPRAVYNVIVSFGNKTIVYDPLDGVEKCMKTIEGVIEVLQHRKDIKNLIQVVEDFNRAANYVLSAFERDGYYVGTKKHA